MRMDPREVAAQLARLAGALASGALSLDGMGMLSCVLGVRSLDIDHVPSGEPGRRPRLRRAVTGWHWCVGCTVVAQITISHHSADMHDAQRPRLRPPTT